MTRSLIALIPCAVVLSMDAASPEIRSGNPVLSGRFYIVYRRPLGESDRNHRVVCIDAFRFDDRGFIVPVVITNQGAPSEPARDR